LLAEGLRTADIKSEGSRVVSTSEMGDAIVAELAHQAAESVTDEENQPVSRCEVSQAGRADVRPQ
jgi:hypothetical protein